MCLSLAACSSSDADTTAPDVKEESEVEKEYLVGVANFDENPDWITTREIDQITYTNGNQSTITVIFTMGVDDFENLPNHAIRQAQQDKDYEIVRNWIRSPIFYIKTA